MATKTKLEDTISQIAERRKREADRITAFDGGPTGGG